MSERISADRAGTFSQAFRAKAKGLGVNAYTCLPPPASLPLFDSIFPQRLSCVLLKFKKMRLFSSAPRQETTEAKEGKDEPDMMDAVVTQEKGDVEAVSHAGGAVRMADIDPEVEKRVVRKFDKHMVPLLATLYLLAFLDRSNIG